jgi:pimeloyl-ACP methyl ester carboxylesterase
MLALERKGAPGHRAVEPVLFLHGLGLDKSVWDDAATALAPRFDTVRLDLRGHGASSLPEGPYAHHDDVVRVLDALELPRAHLVGHSLGGGVALDTALAHPARVKSLALIDPALSGHAWSPAWTASIRAIRGTAQAGGAAAAREAWLGHPLFAHARALPGARARLEAIVRRDPGERWSVRDPVRALDPPAALRLAEVRVPTRIVVGALDLEDFQHIARALAAGIADARLTTLEGVGHLAPLEAPAALNDLLTNFLDQAARRA